MGPFVGRLFLIGLLVRNKCGGRNRTGFVDYQCRNRVRRFGFLENRRSVLSKPSSSRGDRMGATGGKLRNPTPVPMLQELCTCRFPLVRLHVCLLLAILDSLELLGNIEETPDSNRKDESEHSLKS